MYRQRSRVALFLVFLLLIQLILPALPSYYMKAEEKQEAITILEGYNNVEEGFSYFVLQNDSDKEKQLSELEIEVWDQHEGITDSLQLPEAKLKPEEPAIIWLNERDQKASEFKNFIQYEEDEQLIEIKREQAINITDVMVRTELTETRLSIAPSKSEQDSEQEKPMANDEERTKSNEQLENQQNQQELDSERDLPVHNEELQVIEEKNSMEDEQVHEETEWIHQPLTEVNSLEEQVIQVQIPNSFAVETALIHYQTGEGMEIQSLELTNKEDELWEVTLGQHLFWSSEFQYQIEVTSADSIKTLPDEGMFVARVELEEVDAAVYPEILITELLPDSANISGSDAYEFIEIYNNTNVTIELNQLALHYHYPNGRVVEWALPKGGKIPAQTPHTIWIHNGANNHLTLTDFNKHYQTNLDQEDMSIIYTDGMANSAERSLSISYRGSEPQSIATYFEDPQFDDTQPDQGIVYRAMPHTNVMNKVGLNVQATPGYIQEGQVPKLPVVIDLDNEAPIITHVPLTGEQEGEQLTFEATVTDNVRVQSVKLQYKAEGEEAWTTRELTQLENDRYQVVLPLYFFQQGDIHYQLVASDGTNQAQTDTFTFSVRGNDIDTSQVPKLLVTELVPDSTNVGRADGYEFIEVYNNTDQPVSFEDYLIHYEYPAGNYLDWEPEEKDITIPPKEAIVFWIINGENGHVTSAEFNQNYQTELIEGVNLFRMHNSGMANGTERGVGIKTKTGELISIAYYNDQGDADVAPDKGVLYRFPQDGTKKMEKVQARTTDGTPGAVESWQVPQQEREMPIDSTEPTILNQTEVEKVDEFDSVTLKAQIEDETSVKHVELFYKTDRHGEFQKVNLTNEDAPMYLFEIVKPDLIGANQLDYYFVASDGTNTTTSETYSIQVESHWSDDLRLNVNEGDVLSGTYVLKAAHGVDDVGDLSISVDDNPINETSKVLEHDAYFAFDVRGTNIYFKNGVVMDGEVLEIFDDGYGLFTTLMIPIDAKRLHVGENVISIYSGSKASPLDIESPENRNDFDVKNVRLVLADGTVLRDPVYHDPQTLIDIGDDGTYRPFQDFTFTLSDAAFHAQGHVWDTSLLEDGWHVVTAENRQTEEKTSVRVLTDNTAPMITTSLQENHDYKGNFTIHVEAEDEIAGVDQIVTLLDGKQIETPYATSSAQLSPGEHQLKVVATDLVGNEATKEVTFTVVDEHPHSPEQASEGAHLRVKVTDPTEDEMKVTFKEGFRYTLADEQSVSAYQHATDVEPPNVRAPEGEVPFTKEEREKATSLDDSYVTTDSVEQFPYHRFEVEVDESISFDSQIELVWDGASLPGRKVTMYVWNVESLRWDALAVHIAGEEDFQLRAEIIAKSYMEDRKVNVMVQDEIAGTSIEEYDYTFAWLSDTQYYAESYPHIFDSQVNWLAEQKEELNLKYVFHTGDIVDKHYEEFQWENADRSLRVLEDANIPYGVLAGNHDVGNKGLDYEAYGRYFGEDRFKAQPHYGGSYQNNRGHYDLISEGGNDYIMVYLGWGLDEEGIQWVNDVLAAYPERMAVLNVHEYLLATGTRSPDGDRLFEEVVKPNPNVVMVLCGHYHSAELLIDEIDDDGDGEPDRKVYQILADYQGGPEGGQGFIRLLHVDAENNQIHVRTYSPYLDQYNYYDPAVYPEKDEFTLSLGLEPQVKRVSTNAFYMNVYSETEIDVVEGVKHGETAETYWTGLEKGNRYGWYVNVEDEFGGLKRSPIWYFLYEGAGEIIPEPEEEPGEETTEPPIVQPEIPDGENEETPPPGQPGKPQQPENPENPGGPESPSGDLEQEIPDVENEQNTVDEKTGILPHTATNMYNWLLIGMGLILLSSVYFFRRMRTS